MRRRPPPPRHIRLAEPEHFSNIDLYAASLRDPPSVVPHGRCLLRARSCRRRTASQRHRPHRLAPRSGRSVGLVRRRRRRALRIFGGAPAARCRARRAALRLARGVREPGALRVADGRDPSRTGGTTRAWRRVLRRQRQRPHRGGGVREAALRPRRSGTISHWPHPARRAVRVQRCDRVDAARPDARAGTLDPPLPARHRHLRIHARPAQLRWRAVHAHRGDAGHHGGRVPPDGWRFRRRRGACARHRCSVRSGESHRRFYGRTR